MVCRWLATESVARDEDVSAETVEAAADRLREKGVIEERGGEWTVVRESP
jgi:DNA-binding transcriptional regulator YhcF (GntR family)